MYRSPSVSLDAFLSALDAILNHIAMSDIPTVVLGDFNEDLLQKSTEPYVKQQIQAISTVSHY